MFNIKLGTFSMLSEGAVAAKVLSGVGGVVTSIVFSNIGTGDVFLRLYDMATQPGTGDADKIIHRGFVPADGIYNPTLSKGLTYHNGLGIRVSGAAADNDATILVAAEVLGNITWDKSGKGQ